MNLFFTYENELPPDVGYPLFGRAHITILFIFLAAITLVLLLHSRRPLPRRAPDRLTLFLLSASPTALILLRSVYILVIGQSLLYELPLHLCSFAGFFCLLFELLDRQKPKSRSVWFLKAGKFLPKTGKRSLGKALSSFLAQVLYALCLPGALLALLFPNGTMYPPFHFITLESYFFHALTVLYILLRLTDGSIHPAVRDSYKCFLFLCIVLPPVSLFNHRFHTNYMFLSAPSAGSPLYGIYRSFGYGRYLILYALATAAVIFLMNFTWERIAASRKKNLPVEKERL